MVFFFSPHPPFCLKSHLGDAIAQSMALGTWNSVTESALFKMCWDSLQACVKTWGVAWSFHFELMPPVFLRVW